MRALLGWAVIVAFVLLVVMAVLFRSQSARDLLRLGRNAIWVYIAVVFGLALVQLYREGL